jgi:DnaJ-class molecular chaperone
MNLAGSMIKFNKICEAYQVLSNLQHKRIYDMFGEDGLKNGVTNPVDGTHSGSYAYFGNSIEIFEAFFGSKNPYTDNFFVSTRKE